MDRYIIREARAGAECLQGNQIIAFPSTAGNNMIPEQFYTPYGADYQNFQNGRESRHSVPQTSYPPTNMPQGQTPITSGIDPNYLAAYSGSNAAYMPGHQHMQREVQMERQMQFRPDPFGGEYQNRHLTVERNKTFVHAHSENPRNYESKTPRVNPNYSDTQPKKLTIYNTQPKLQITDTKTQTPKIPQQMPPRNSNVVPVPPKKPSETETPKNELQSQLLTRFDKLKALHRTGPRVFSGPVEKVLKWHKALQDIGVLIIYEVVAKCVSVQPGASCSKNLVIRDGNGPAMQVVYYEIDFLLPELKPPCTVRVVGRMMPGTCRLQAFNVRPATGDDVATLQRRAAVASHHVAKLCKEYGGSDQV